MPAKHLLKNASFQLAKLAVAPLAQVPVQPVQRPQLQQPGVPIAARPLTSPTSTLNLQPHPSQLLAPNAPKVAAVQEHLSYLRTELHKMAAELGETCMYSSEKIDEITSSPEAFEKAAQEEAQCVWAGIEDTLRKEGADQDFIDGIKKEAFVMPALRMIGRGLGRAGGAIGTGLKKVGPALGRGLEHSVVGTTLGGLAGGVPGALAGGLFTGLGGTMGYGKATLLGGGALAAGTYMGAKGLGDSGNDITGNPASRNRALPFAPNKVTGGIGGALLGSLLANEMGMSGHAAWMMPVLGGLAGYHHLPNMMDKWKDPYGYGANTMSAGAAHMNRAMPLMN